MNRNIAVDGFRGLLLLIIAINHIESTALMIFTKGNFGYISAAEGFIFLSGIMSYLAYKRFIDAPSSLYNKVFRRVGQIYLYTLCGLTIVFLSLQSNLLPEVWYRPLGNYFLLENYINFPLQTYVFSALQIQQIGYFDILIVYLLSMLFLPKALMMLHQGKAWLVLLISSLVWLSAHFISDSAIVSFYQGLVPGMKPNSGYLDVLAWQLLFYSGLVASYYYHTSKPIFFNNKIVIALVLALALAFIAVRQLELILPLPEHIISFFYSWQNMGIIRLLNTFVFAALVVILINKLPQLFSAVPLVQLGQHSLQVFTFHAVAIYYFWPWMVKVKNNYFVGYDIALTFAFVLTLFVPVNLHVQWQKRVKH